MTAQKNLLVECLSEAWRRRKVGGAKGGVNESINQSGTTVFVEQPLYLLGSTKEVDEHCKERL